jgi:tetratricopeptide (TPR) repeat protein
MRTRLIAAGLAAAVLLGMGGSLRAGVYNTANPLPYPLPGDFRQFRSGLGELRGIASTDPNVTGGLHKLYRNQLAALEAKARAGQLTVTDRIDLSACNIRLLKYEEAVQALGPAEAEDPDNFMVLANLATANHLAGRIDRAVIYQQQALRNWPGAWTGFSWEQLRWYRTAEEYYLKLLELRQQEERVQPGSPPATVDALFPGARFGQLNGKYEVGPWPDEELDKLPYYRLPVVSQLVWWLPYDDRLYWLLAELLNAQGDIEAASTIMDDLSYNRRFDIREFRRHRQIIKPVADLWVGKKGAETREQLLWALAPRQPGLDGAPMRELGWAGSLHYLMKADPTTNTGVVAAPPDDKPAGSPPAPWLPDWRTFVVGMGSGALLALLIAQQVRQSRRRVEQGAGVRKAG